MIIIEKLHKTTSMTQELQKAKQILSKPFCFMQWQVDDAFAKGDEPMTKEDIQYLLSLSVDSKTGEHFDMMLKSGYDSEELFAAIDLAKKKELDSVWMIGATLNAQDARRVKDQGYFVRIEWLGSTMLDEIYFSEEAATKADIAKFQSLFKGITGMVYLML